MVLSTQQKQTNKQTNNNKKNPIVWEKMFANDATDNSLIPKIYEQHIQLSIKKSTQSENEQKT